MNQMDLQFELEDLQSQLSNVDLVIKMIQDDPDKTCLQEMKKDWDEIATKIMNAQKKLGDQ